MIPTVRQIFVTFLSNIESKINQQSPLNPKAFNRVLSAAHAIIAKSLYNFGVDRAKQAFAVTAGEDGLTILGDEFNVPRKTAASTVLTITLPGTNGTIIPATNYFTGDSNGVRYEVDASATMAGGFATISVTSSQPGVIGNLVVGQDTLSIGNQVAGAETVATVTATTTTGAEEETLDSWRIRILDVMRSPGGGGNSADYRNWSQEVAGVHRAYPYAGKPAALLATSSPPDRTVYVEATTDIDSDGIAPPSLLDQVRDSITTDPATGFSRQPLGLTDDTLYVESITRTGFFVQITGLTVDASIESSVKTEIDTELEKYFRTIRPFVDGLDAPTENKSLITDLTVSNVVQDVLSANGGSAQSVAFDIVSGGSLPEYQLGQGEMADHSGTTYV